MGSTCVEGDFPSALDADVTAVLSEVGLLLRVEVVADVDIGEVTDAVVSSGSRAVYL